MLQSRVMNTWPSRGHTSTICRPTTAAVLLRKLAMPGWTPDTDKGASFGENRKTQKIKRVITGRRPVI